jgi:hypothetical protein
MPIRQPTGLKLTGMKKIMTRADVSPINPYFDRFQKGCQLPLNHWHLHHIPKVLPILIELIADNFLGMHSDLHHFINSAYSWQ